MIRRFSGRRSSFSEIHSKLAQVYSNWRVAKLTGESVDIPTFRNVDVLGGLLDPYDLEHLVYVYLQVARNYFVIPASRRTDAAAYEYALDAARRECDHAVGFVVGVHGVSGLDSGSLL